MCSGASSVMWEAAAPHFQVVGALSCLYAYTSRRYDGGAAQAELLQTFLDALSCPDCTC